MSYIEHATSYLFCASLVCGHVFLNIWHAFLFCLTRHNTTMHGIISPFCCHVFLLGFRSARALRWVPGLALRLRGSWSSSWRTLGSSLEFALLGQIAWQVMLNNFCLALRIHHLFPRVCLWLALSIQNLLRVIPPSILIFISIHLSVFVYALCLHFWVYLY